VAAAQAAVSSPKNYKQVIKEDFADQGYVYAWTSSNDLVIIVLAEPSGDPLKYGAVQWNPFNTEIQTIARQMNDTSQSVLLSLLWQCPS
jgi:hypothetical protein